MPQRGQHQPLSHPKIGNKILSHSPTMCTDKSPWKCISDLKDQNLSRGEIYNLWCDHLAATTMDDGSCPIEDPGVTPAERWVVYSKFRSAHKITGPMSEGIYSTLDYKALASFIEFIHGLHPFTIEGINLYALQHYLNQLKPHKRASTIKLIQNWVPTYSTLCRQGRAPFSPLPQMSTVN
jgi:hypothetical protein